MRLFYQATGFLTAIAILTSAAQAQEDELGDPVVRGLSFQGNHAIDDFTLRISIGTSQSAWFARFPLVSWLGLGEKRYFNDTEFRRDVERIKALYRASGFWNVRVDTLVRRNDGDINIRFVIDEGEPIRVTSIEVVGAEPILLERELLDLPLREGDPFNRLRLRASADTMRSLLRDRGYPFAQVFRRFDQHLEEHRADVSFEVVPGVRAVVDSVEVVGADRIGEDVVRRMISIRPGDLFRERDLYESQLDLYRLGAYNYVGIGLADTVPRVGDDSLVTVRVRVSEGPLRRVRLGVGYGTIDCFRTLTSWTVQDFLGGGRVLRLDAGLSKIGTGSPFSADFHNNVCKQLKEEVESPERLELNYNVSASLREPHLFSRHTSGRLSVFVEKHSEFNAYLRKASGGEVAMTYSTPWNIPITLAYSLVYGRTLADEATYCSELGLCTADERKFLTDANYRSTVSLALLRDRTDSRFFPTRGSVLTAQVLFSSGRIGSDERSGFAKGVIDFVSFHPIGRRAVFAWRVRAGTILPPKVTLQAQDIQFVPPEERFYGGGANTVRGFGQNELGPLVWVLDSRAGSVGRDEILADSTFVGVTDTIYIGDLRSAPTGGNDLFLANMELRFPLPGFAGRVSGGVFVDVGQIFRRGKDERGKDELFGFRELRITPGAGLRYASPLGPIRLDVGFNPGDPQEGDLLLDADPPEGSPNQPRKLVLLKEKFRPKPGFLGHFRIHFSIGQAF